MENRREAQYTFVDVLGGGWKTLVVFQNWREVWALRLNVCLQNWAGKGKINSLSTCSSRIAELQGQRENVDTYQEQTGDPEGRSTHLRSSTKWYMTVESFLLRAGPERAPKPSKAITEECGWNRGIFRHTQASALIAYPVPRKAPEEDGLSRKKWKQKENMARENRHTVMFVLFFKLVDLINYGLLEKEVSFHFLKKPS